MGKYRNGCDGLTVIRLTAWAKPHLKHSEQQETPISKMPHQRNKTPFIPLSRIVLLEMWGSEDICCCKYNIQVQIQDCHQRGHQSQGPY